MMIKTYTREQAINILLDNMKEAMIDDWQYFEDILKNGFDGFSNHTNEELGSELKEFFDEIEDIEQVKITDEPMCTKYPNDKILPDENNKCSLCGTELDQYGGHE